MTSPSYHFPPFHKFRLETQKQKNMACLQGTDLEKLKELCEKSFKDQAVWCLNGFWHDFGEKEAENIWNFVQLCVELNDRDASGCKLDEMKAHRFLEKLKDTHTVLEVRLLASIFPSFPMKRFTFFPNSILFCSLTLVSSSVLNFAR